jgi:hypothetical protein
MLLLNWELELCYAIFCTYTSCHDRLLLHRDGRNTPLHHTIKGRQPIRRKLAMLKLLLEKAPTGVRIIEIEDDKRGSDWLAQDG